jgi:hypothetical protein
MDNNNGHSRLEDFRAYTDKVHTMEVEMARISESVRHLGEKIDNLSIEVRKISEEESPKTLRDKTNMYVQVLTVLLVLVSMILPHLK